jgi:hypothetical protein
MDKEFENHLLETIQESRLKIITALTPEQLLEVTDIYELRIQKLEKKVKKLKKVIKELEK